MASSLVASVTALVVVSVAYHVVSGRTLGIYLTGLITAATVALLDPAVALFATREAGALPAQPDPEDPHLVTLQETHQVCLALSLPLLLGGLALAGGAGALLGAGSEVTLALVLLGVLPALQVATALLPAVATGRSAFGVVATGTLVSAVTTLVTSLVLVIPFGVPGLALGQLLGVAAGRLVILRWLRRAAPWLRFPSRWPTRAALGRSLASTRSFMLLAATAQVINWTDVVIIANLRGAEDVARYRIGVMIPTQLVALAFRGFDVIYPRLARASADDHLTALRLPTRVLCSGAGAVFGALIALRHDVMTLTTGADDVASRRVLILITLAWAANVPVHALALLLMARGHQSLLLPITLLEAVGNIVLTIAATVQFGVVGAAAATLASIAVSNLLVLPAVSRRRIPGARRVVYVDGLLPLAASLLVLLVLTSAASRIADGRSGTLVALAVAVAGVVAVPLLSAGRAGRGAILQSLRRA